MSDIWTMIWKESKDLLFQGGWKSLIRPFFVIGIMGIYLPLQVGADWISLTPIYMILVLWVPFFVVISFIGDAIAGERERHTLETLLASRMPDRAILLGKIAATVLYAWGMGIFSLLLGLVLVDLLRTQGNWLFYPLDLFVDALILILLASLLATSAGVLVSLKSATVRQAQQILSIGTIVFVFGVTFVLRAIPANVLSSLSYPQFLLSVMVFLAVLDAILLALSFMSFQRSRLILS
ncbi:MAG TPA: ABC transporter permease [Ktedonobacteraceae bacterium]|nr:ABC transporter permease [Ktedonobacteraceae bacterium]